MRSIGYIHILTQHLPIYSTEYTQVYTTICSIAPLAQHRVYTHTNTTPTYILDSLLAEHRVYTSLRHNILNSSACAMEYIHYIHHIQIRLHSYQLAVYSSHNVPANNIQITCAVCTRVIVTLERCCTVIHSMLCKQSHRSVFSYSRVLNGPPQHAPSRSV